MHRLAFFYGFECPLDPSFVLIVGWSRITRVSKVDRTRSNIEYDISSWDWKIGLAPHASDEVSVLSGSTPYQTKALKSRMITMMTQRLLSFIWKVVSDSHLVHSLFDWLYVIYHMLWQYDSPMFQLVSRHNQILRQL